MQHANHIVTTSPALRRLLLDCQEWCRADCCKERAFTITEVSIARWLRLERIDRSREVAEEIRQIGACLPRSHGWVFLAVRGVESDWRADDFRAFWCRLEAAFRSGVDAQAADRVEQGAPI